MAGVFPDSGVLASDAKNSLVNPDTVNCEEELWYSTSRCQPRFDPAAANAVVSEIVNVVNCAGLPYDCTKLDNLCTAIKNLICDVITNCLNPCDFQLKGPSGTLHQLMLQDASGCRRIVKELVQTTSMDLWVRTDGNDTTGDGSANTADKAFRTIAGAWNSVAKRTTVTSPIYPLNIRLGIPGTYEPGNISNYGGPVFIYGDIANRRNYRISQSGSTPSYCVRSYRTTLTVIGCTLVADVAYANTLLAVAEGGGVLNLYDMEYEVRTDLGSGGAIWATLTGGNLSMGNGQLIRGIGAVRSLRSVWWGSSGGLFWGAQAPGADIEIENLNFLNGCVDVTELSICRWVSCTVTSSGCTGPEYLVQSNSLFMAFGQTVPGDVAGTVATGGQFIP